MNPLRVGSLVEFIYDRGSHPGSKRLVKIENVNNLTVSGIDQDINEFRNFTRSYIRNLKVAPAHTFSFEEEKRDLSIFLKKNPGYGVEAVQRFNKRWNVNYFFDGMKVKERNSLLRGDVTLDKDLGILTININGKILKIQTSTHGNAILLDMNGRAVPSYNLVESLL